MSEQSIGENKQNHATDGIERRECQPQNAQQPNVFGNAAAPRKTYWFPGEFLPAPPTETLI
jgi:hypothetical protein